MSFAIREIKTISHKQDFDGTENFKHHTESFTN